MTLYMLGHEKQYGTAVVKAAKGQDPVQSLEQVLDDLTTNFGAWQVPWGDLNRLERRQSGGEEPFPDDVKSLPVAGAPGAAGLPFYFLPPPRKTQNSPHPLPPHPLIHVPSSSL